MSSNFTVKFQATRIKNANVSLCLSSKVCCLSYFYIIFCRFEPFNLNYNIGKYYYQPYFFKYVFLSYSLEAFQIFLFSWFILLLSSLKMLLK